MNNIVARYVADETDPTYPGWADFTDTKMAGRLSTNDRMPIDALRAYADQVHLGYERFPGVAIQHLLLQVSGGTFYKGGFGGNAFEEHSRYNDTMTVLADGVTFGFIDDVNAAANDVIARKTAEGNGGVWGFSRGSAKVGGAALVTAVTLMTGGAVLEALPAGAAVPTTLALNAPAVTSTASFAFGTAGTGFALYSGYETIDAYAEGDSARAGESLAVTIASAVGLKSSVQGMTSGARNLYRIYGPAPKINSQLVLSGHGAYESNAGMTTVPENTSVTFWGRSGSLLDNSVANLIETGQYSRILQSAWMQAEITGSRTFLSGARIPNYTLFPNENPALSLMGKPMTVFQPTTLDDLLRPGMGPVNWAACQEVLGCFPPNVTGPMK